MRNMLHLVKSGTPSDEPPVILIHGLFGSGKNLGGIARRLNDHREVISVDLRNHGDSFHDDDQTYPALADDLIEVIMANGGTADLVGHSMGGKTGMIVALTRPEVVRKLAVLDISPIGYGHTQMGLIDAMEALDLDGLKLRSEADRRLSARIKDPGVRAFLLQSLDLKSDPPRWKMNLHALREHMPDMVGWPEGLQPGAFHGPTLFLSGANSDYCDVSGTAAIKTYFPQAEVRTIPDAGHWLHAEQPELVSGYISDFLA